MAPKSRGLEGIDISDWPWDLQMSAIRDPEAARQKVEARDALFKRLGEIAQQPGGLAALGYHKDQLQQEESQP